MKGLKALSDKTKNVFVNDRSSWITLYYSIAKDTVYTKDGEGRFFMTYLINPCTPKDIEKTVIQCLNR